MILIADGGSTKADWIALDDSKNEVFRERTLGLNPAVVSEDELSNRIVNMELFDVSGKLLDHFEGSETELKRNYSFLPKGNYFLKITTEQNYETHKIIIQ